MKYYDLNIKGHSYESDLRLILEANRLGWTYLNLVYSPDKYNMALDYKDELKEKLDNIVEIGNLKNRIEFEFGIELNVGNPNDIRKNSRKFRNKTKFISVLGGDSGINRIACENIQIDVLSRPYLRRRDCGINHILSKEAFKNNVAIELCFKDILTSYLSYRSKILAHFREIIKLHQKFKFPLIITTGSSSIFDIRSPRDMIALFKSFGLSEYEVKSCLANYPKDIVLFNNDRKNMVVLGVKEIDK